MAIVVKSLAFNKLIEEYQPKTISFTVNDEMKKRLEQAGLEVISEPDSNSLRIQKCDNAKGFFRFKHDERGEVTVVVGFEYYDRSKQEYVADFVNCDSIGGYKHWHSQWCGRHDMSAIYGREAQLYMESVHSAILEALGAPVSVKVGLSFVALNGKTKISYPGGVVEENVVCLFAQSEILKSFGQGG